LPINEFKLVINDLNPQEFQFRVQKLCNDEFGSLAKIINERMVDFEELQGVGDFKEKVLLLFL